MYRTRQLRTIKTIKWKMQIPEFDGRNVASDLKIQKLEIFHSVLFISLLSRTLRSSFQISCANCFIFFRNFLLVNSLFWLHVVGLQRTRHPWVFLAFVMHYRIADGRRTVALSKRKVSGACWLNLFASRMALRDPSNNSWLTGSWILTFQSQVVRSSSNSAIYCMYSIHPALNIQFYRLHLRTVSCNTPSDWCCVFMPAAGPFECFRQ